MTKYDIAVVGATGNVGREIIEILHTHKFPYNKVYALASKNSVGKQVSFGLDGDILTVDALDDFDFSKVKIAFFSAGGDISAKYAPIAASKGCYVIDNTSYFRMNDDVPLIVPEVNPQDISIAKKTKIIANPNCSTAQMVVPLKPLHDKFNIKRIVVSTYQAVSGAGQEAMDELFYQTKKMYEADSINPTKFTKQIAFNCIPNIDKFLPDGNTKEEWKMIVETQKILDKNIQVSATCVRVPVFNCHSESVNVEFNNKIDIDEIKEILLDTNGVLLVDKPSDNVYQTPVETSKMDPVFVSRLRVDDSVPNGINMWIVADNLRKGAALNSVQIAELLVNKLF